MTEPLLHPLLRVDPPKVGGWWLDARLGATPSGVAYTAHAEAGEHVMVVMLSEGATADPAAVDRFAGTVDRMHIDTVLARGGRGQAGGRLGHKHVSPTDTPLAPDSTPEASWVALAWDGSPAAVAEAHRVLAEVDLSWLPPKGTPSGPDYQLPWVDKVAPGLVRQWPLPWPGRSDRAGWLSILISWLIMMLLMALAVLIAILIFQATPPQSPPPPVPTSASGTGGGTGSPSPQSGSPSPQSGSPSPASGSPEPSPGESAEQASPTPDRRL